MSFAYKNVVVSGSRLGVEGAARGIQEIKSVLVNQMGWTLHDDRTTQAGANHKLVLRSNGESNDKPTFYLILTSGTGAGGPEEDAIAMQVSTFWDAAAHTVGSGIAVPSTVSNVWMFCESQADYPLWISGDKDAVHFATYTTGSIDTISLGRSYTFLSTSLEPYGLFNNGNASASPSIKGSENTGRGVVGNPPMALDSSSDVTFLNYTFATTNQPGNLQDPPLFTFAPLMFMADDSVAPVRRGAIGLVPGIWSGIGTTGGLQNFFTLVSSGTFGIREYIVFSDSTESVIFRKS